MAQQIPVIDLAVYYSQGPQSPEAEHTVQAIHDAASTWGFFILTSTKVSPQVQSSLLSVSQAFFDLPLEVKQDLDVRNGGTAWRGYMPFGGEQTHGRTDWKEGLYVGPEHFENHPLAGQPLHGKNQFPDQILPSMRPKVMEYINEVVNLGKTLTDIFSLALGLKEGELRERLLEPEPVVLFRCFKYSPVANGLTSLNTESQEGFGIGEHTGQSVHCKPSDTSVFGLILLPDFGYLTILKVDSPGLQVSIFIVAPAPTNINFKVLTPSDEWLDVPLVENSLIVNSK